jgi:hypothetical protein
MDIYTSLAGPQGFDYDCLIRFHKSAVTYKKSTEYCGEFKFVTVLVHINPSLRFSKTSKQYGKIIRKAEQEAVYESVIKNIGSDVAGV